MTVAYIESCCQAVSRGQFRASCFASDAQAVQYDAQTVCSLLPPQVYLQQGHGAGTGAAGDQTGLDSERWTEIAELLSRKHDRIDPLHALSLLPDGVRRVAAICLHHDVNKGLHSLEMPGYVHCSGRLRGLMMRS